MTSNGWIKIHRKILNWEWYKDLKTRVLFMHLLLVANHEDQQFCGTTVKTGETARSLQTLSAETCLTIRQVRGAINNLKMTGEVTDRRFKDFRIITIKRYSYYQRNDMRNGTQTTVETSPERQTIRHSNDTKQEVKNKEIKKENTPRGGGDESQPQKEYGNPLVNEVIRYTKQQFELPILDGTADANRNAAYLLLKKFTPEINGKKPAPHEGSLKAVKAMIDVGARSKYWRGRIAKIKDLHDNAVSIGIETRRQSN